MIQADKKIIFYPKNADKVMQTIQKEILYIGTGGEEICQQLSDLRYSIYSVSDFSKAFYWLENQLLSDAEMPVAIISDFRLNEENVFMFYNKIKLNPILRLIPFIVVAEDGTREDKIRSLKIGIDDFYIDRIIAHDLSDRIHFLHSFKKLTAAVTPKPHVSLSQFIPIFKIPFLKRLFDIVVSSIGLIVLGPLFLILAVLIKLESEGPVFYISKRAGTGYKIFNFYKFRSMKIDADKEIKNLKHLNQYSAKGKNSSFVKIENDPRITKIGNFMRNTSLDELPQLINVLIGNMSLVGNRPLPLYEAEQLTRDQWAKRFLAPAGITGLWQVTKRGKGGEMLEEERMELDIAYAEKSSFLFDLIILLKTIPALFQEKTA